MKFYRVSLVETDQGHQGYVWFASKDEAERKQREWMKDHKDDDAASADIELVMIPSTKRAMLAWLGTYAAHEDNG